MKSQAAFDVLVCGSLHLDIVVRAPSLPRIDETAVGQSWQQVCGGKGGNQAVQAARAGAKTAMIGRIGNDEFGRILLSNLVRSNVDTSCISSDVEQGSGMSVAILQDNGDYGAVIVSGANLTIDAIALQAQYESLGGAKIVVLQNEVPQQVNVALAKLARKTGAKIILNAAPAREFESDLLDQVDVLVVNRVEAAALSGMPVNDPASARAALSNLIGVNRGVVVTLGGEGMIVSTPDGNVEEIEAIPVDVTSTHGAGDCFIGVLAAELAGGATLLAASRAANAAASKHVARDC